MNRMSLWYLAARNVWQNRGRYLAYLGSAAFAVMIYFLYSALIYHPELQGGYRGARYALQGMRAAVVVIAVSTFLFLLYSSSAFIRSRMKEFGLLSLLGFSRRQLVRLILAESLIIGTVAVASGLGLGLLFLKLFFLAISALLGLTQSEQIPLYAGTPVWVSTTLVFGSFFVVVSLASLGRVLRRSVIDLVRAGRQPKGNPAFSRWQTVLGLLMVVGGYTWASLPKPTAVVRGVIPVTAMVSAGTYFLIREGSIALLSWLHRRERFFYRPGPFLTVSQLVYKLQDNYRVLSAVAILVAVILTAVGTAYTMYVMVLQDTLNSSPQAIQVVQQGSLEPSAAVAQVEAVLRRHGVTGMHYRELVTWTATLRSELPGKDTRSETRPAPGQFGGTNEKREIKVTPIPYSFYASVERPQGERFTLDRPGMAIRVYPYFIREQYRMTLRPVTRYLVIPPSGRVVTPGDYVSFQVIPDQAGRLLNELPEGNNLLVLDDGDFARLLQRVPAAQRIHIAMWNGKAWKDRAVERAVAELRTLFPAGGPVQVTAAVEGYRASLSTMGVVLFIGVFVSLVFFAACFSLLYSRLFTEIEDDRRYLWQLARVGVSGQELRRLALQQAAIIFFVPFIAGLLHSTFAMQALGTLTGRMVLQYGWLVACGYLLLYGLAFAATAAFYWRSLHAGLSGCMGREMVI